MKRVASSAGFTIVETMIVLAVTGMLFVAVSIGWNGKQRSSEYLTSSRNTATIIQQTISDVENGYFPSTANFSCRESGAVLDFDAFASAQGTNSQCIFLGKAIEFKTTPDSPEGVSKYTVAGSASATGSNPALWKATLAPSLTERLFLPADMETRSVTVSGRGGTYVGLLFLSDVGTTVGGKLQSGRQSIKIYGLKSPAGLDGAPLFNNTTPPDGVPLNTSTNFDNVPITDGAKICFKSGSSTRFTVMTVGAGGNTSSVSTETREACS